ncbi:ergosterol biosynthesis protein [Toensbergia leucococca]|nr:ergosterol biosynthesis protein [Toensbergia leucococca]
MAGYLPQSAGLLPKWLLLVSLVSALNSVQTYLTLTFTRRVYDGPVSTSSSQVTPLFARTFGTWTFLSAVIRLYGAYRLDDGDMYKLVLWTFALALIHFGSEWLVFRTARLGLGLLPSLMVASGSLTWMVWQWEYYVD